MTCHMASTDVITKTTCVHPQLIAKTLACHTTGHITSASVTIGMTTVSHPPASSPPSLFPQSLSCIVFPHSSLPSSCTLPPHLPKPPRPSPSPPWLQVRKDYKQMVGDYKSLASKAKKKALYITWPLLQPLASGICSMRPHVLGTFSHTALFLRPAHNNKLTSGVCSKKKNHFYVSYNDEQ